MWGYIFMFLALVAGTLCGMGGMLLLAGGTSLIRKHKEKSEKEEQVKKAEKSPETEKPEILERLLTPKLPFKEFSVTDFNCAADGHESDEHIVGRQRRQDNAYNNLKSRKSDK